MIEDWEKIGGSARGSDDWEPIGEPRPRKPKVRRSIFEIATDPSIPLEERDKRIIRTMGYDPQLVTISESYKPGSIVSRVMKQGDPRERIGKSTGGGWILGAEEGVAGPLRQVGLALAHGKEALGIGKAPKADRILSEIYSNIDLENYNKAVTDPDTGERKSGSTIAPLLSQLLLTKKLPVKGKIAAFAGRPLQQGAIMGSIQNSPIRGGQSGESDWGANTAFSTGLGGAVNTVATPLVSAGLNKLAGTEFGEKLAMKAAKGPTTIEDLKARLSAALGGEKPGNIAQQALKESKDAKWKELNELFTVIGRRAKGGDVDTSEIVGTIDRHLAKLGKEGTLESPLINHLQDLRSRLTQGPVKPVTSTVDPVLGARSEGSVATMLRGPSEAGTTFPDMMREYKIAGEKMRSAYDKGRVMSGSRGGIEYDLKTAIENAAKRHDPDAAAKWAEARGRWRQEFKPYTESDIGALIDSDTPNIALKTVMADKTGDRLANLSRVPMDPRTRAALQSEYVDELGNVYGKRIRGPMGEESSGGPRGVEHMIRGPEHSEFVKNVFPGESGQELSDIASRARAADVTGRSLNTAGGALAGGMLGAGGGVGGAIAAYRFLPNFTSKMWYRMMESPSIRQLVSQKYGIPENSPMFQKLIDELAPKAASQSASSYTGGNPFLEDEQ